MAEGDVFTDRKRTMRVTYSDSGVAHDTSHEPSQMTGWREKADGSLERAAYLAGGWIVRQKARSARKAKPFPGHFDIWFGEGQSDPT